LEAKKGRQGSEDQKGGKKGTETMEGAGGQDIHAGWRPQEGEKKQGETENFIGRKEVISL